MFARITLCVVVILSLISGVAMADDLWYPFDTDRGNPTCGFGCYEGHEGSDWSCDPGTPIYSATSGTVIDVDNSVSGQTCYLSFGNYVKIQNEAGDIQTIYAHLLQNSINVTEGAYVQAGQLIAKSSNTGYTLKLVGEDWVCNQGGGEHLHFEVRVKIGGTWTAVNPYTYDGGMWTNSLEYGKSVDELMDDAFTRNGGVNTVGYEATGIYAYGPYLRRDYENGSYGDCCILYDPNNGWDNPDATNEAYLLRTGFLQYYESQERGGSASGCPTRDEYHPETGAEGDAIQFFLRHVDDEPQFHYMYFEANLPTNEPPGEVISWHSTYATDYVSQNPTGQFSMQQGETKTFTVTFRNESQFTWHNNPSSYPYDYVELKSCDASGATCESFLYYSSWLNSISPCTMQESSVAPGDVATFTFTGKVDESASTALHLVYFRVNHSVGGLMEGWDGTHFQVYVMPELSGDDFVAFTGNFNGDNKADVGLWDTVNGDWYFAYRDPNSNQFIPEVEPLLEDWAAGGGYKLLVADFSGDGYDDLCVYYYSTGRWFVAYNWDGYFAPAIGSNNYWIDGWASGNATSYIPMAGKYNNDALFDVAVFHPVTGRWFVAYNSGSKSFTSQGLWLDDWGDGSYGTYWPFTGNLNTDAYYDVGCYHPGTGRWFGAYRSGSSFATDGLWLDSWATGSSTTWKNFFGKSSSDSYDDIIVYKPSEGKWCVAYNWDGYFAQANGADYQNSWLYSWAVEDGELNWQTFVKDVSGDGYVDLIAYTPQYGRWFVAYNQAGPPPYFSLPDGPYTNDSWLNNWGVEIGGSPKIADANPEGLLPVEFTLNQNYPNPFNPMTVISYTLPAATDVRLDIFNILGQRVTTLVNQKQEAGEYTITWDASRFSSGVYLYRIQTAEAVETKKMLLLK